MTTHSKLCVRPDPYPDESPFGYLLRLIDWNGLQSVEHLLDIVSMEGRPRPSLFELMHQPDAAQTLDHHMGKSAGTFARIIYSGRLISRQTWLNYRGMFVPAWAIRQHTGAICTACLAEVAYIRSHWDLLPMQGCAKHNARLISSCPACQTPLAMWRREVVNCGHCGHDLRESPVTGLSCEESADSRWLSDAFIDKPAVAVGGHSLSPSGWFSLWALIWHLVQDSLEVDLSRIRIPKESCFPGDQLATSLRVLRTWDSFEPLVADYLWKRAGRFPGLGMTAWSLPLLERLRSHQFRAPEFDLVREAVSVAQIQVVSECLKIGPTGTGADAGTDIHFSPRQTARVLGLPARTISSPAGRSELAKRRCAAGDGMETSATRLCTWLSGIRHRGATHQVAPIISIGQLVRSGQLVTAGRSIWQLLEHIESGQMKVAEWHHADSLAALQLLRADVHAFLRPRQEDDGYLTVPQIAERLSTYPDAIYRLIKAGKFPVERKQLQRGGRQYCATEADLLAFDMQYVLAGALARSFGVNPTNFADKLRDAGVEPVSGPGIDEGLIYVFRRDDLKAIDLRAVAAKVHYQARTGRRKPEAVTPRSKFAQLDLMSSLTAAKRLGISIQRLGRLVKAGHLSSVAHTGQLGNRRMFERRTIEAFCSLYRENPDWITIHEAEKLFGVSAMEFHRNWIASGRLQVMSDGLGRYTRRSNALALLADNEKRLTRSQAKRLLGIDKSTFSNWQRLGKIQPISGPGIDELGNFLFDKEDVLSLMPSIVKAQVDRGIS